MKEILCPICAGIGEVWAPAGWGNRQPPCGREVLIPCQHCQGSGFMKDRRTRATEARAAMAAAIQAVEESDDDDS
jgi:hypothetical protein